jgi:fimbrial chaperone protein
MKNRLAGALALVFAALSAPAFAASLQVSPVNLEVQGKAAVINLRNDGDETIQTQIRILKWTQVNGKDELLPTRDVVASPPAAKIAPGADYVIRVVRISKAPMEAEETYRILVDQLPRKASKSGTNVNFIMRYSIPVFFGSGGAQAPQLRWAAVLRDGKIMLSASNAGSRRVRLSAVKLQGPKGPLLNLGDGLAGYVLGGATNTLITAKAPKGAAPGTTLRLTARTDQGPVSADLTLASN